MILKNLLLNCQDLFIFLDKYDNENIHELNEPKWQLLTSSFYSNKELSKVYEISNLIKIKKPHIISLVEVGGKESFDNFNKHFLNSEYQVFHYPSNSNRGIDTGFLVHKSLSKLCELKHINNHKLENNKKFSRGVLRLKVKLKNQNIHLLLCHLKSKLDIKKEDFEGRSQRLAEVNGTIKEAKRIYQNDENTAIAILGDLNGIIYKDQTEEELQAFAKNDFIDLLEENDTSLEERTSYVYFKNNHDRVLMQLDFVLGNKKFRNIVQDACICDFEGNKSPILPTKMKEKRKLPSDHFPYYFEMDLSIL